MKDIRCLLGIHKFNEWVEVENHHLKRECLRCEAVETIYPDLNFVLTNWSKLSPETMKFVVDNLGRIINEELDRRDI